MLRSNQTITTDDPLEAPMFRVPGSTSWQCGWCPEVCGGEFWMVYHRRTHRRWLQQMLAWGYEQVDGRDDRD